jgi:hypothetical protein
LRCESRRVQELVRELVYGGAADAHADSLDQRRASSVWQGSGHSSKLAYAFIFSMIYSPSRHSAMPCFAEALKELP